MVQDDAAVGRRLKHLRELAGRTQAYVAERMAEEGVDGIYPQTIVRIESGQRALKWAEAAALARILDFDLVELEADKEAVTRDRFTLGVVAHYERKLRELRNAQVEVDLIRQNLVEIARQYDLSPPVARKLQVALEGADG